VYIGDVRDKNTSPHELTTFAKNLYTDKWNVMPNVYTDVNRKVSKEPVFSKLVLFEKTTSFGENYYFIFVTNKKL